MAMHAFINFVSRNFISCDVFSVQANGIKPLKLKVVDDLLIVFYLQQGRFISRKIFKILLFYLDTDARNLIKYDGARVIREL
jgi:hypothetical protein